MTILCLFALCVRKGALLAGVSGSNGQAAGIIVVRSGVLPGFGSVCAHNYEFQAVIFCYACGKIFGSKKEKTGRNRWRNRGRPSLVTQLNARKAHENSRISGQTNPEEIRRYG